MNAQTQPQQVRRSYWLTAAIALLVLGAGLPASVLCIYVLNAIDPFGRSAIGATGLAEQALGNGDVDAAFKWANQAIEIDPHFYPPYEVRGRVWELRGQYKKALRDFTTLSSFRLDGYVERGRVYEKLGSLDMAADDYCRALRDGVTSRNSARLFSIARVFPNYTTDDEAIADTKAFFAEAITQDPENQELRDCESQYLKALANDSLTPPRDANDALDVQARRADAVDSGNPTN